MPAISSIWRPLAFLPVTLSPLRKKSWDLSLQLDNHGVTPHNWLCKLSPDRTSGWKRGSGSQDQSGFSNCRLCRHAHEAVGPGHSLNWSHSTAGGPAPQWMYTWDMTASMLVTWWKQHLRDIRVKCHHAHGSGGAKINANTGSHESSHNTWKMTHRACSKVHIPKGAILSGFSPSWCAPVPLDQKNHRSEAQLRNRLGTLLH